MVDLRRIVELRGRRLAEHHRQERHAAAKLTKARTAVDRAREDMQIFSDEIATLEQGLLAELVGKHITLDDINKIDEKLRKVEQKAQDLAAQYDTAKQELETAEDHALQMRQVRVRAESKFNKIREVDNIQRAKARALRANAQDAEMDNLAEVIAARGRS